MKSALILTLLNLCAVNNSIAANTHTGPVASTPTTTATTITSDTSDSAPMIPNKLKPSEALERLMLGNKLYIENDKTCPEDVINRRKETAEKQTPFAIVLGCSDSRVSPEFIFAQSVGDIFVVRTAGNSAGPIELESIEFSVEHNNSSVILVLGHQNCAAVQAVYNDDIKDIPDIARYIKPTVDTVKTLQHHTLDDAIVANIRNSMDRIKASPVVKKYIQDKKIIVRGGYYHLESGKVELLHE